jgi:hypothetical protein
MSTRKRTSGPDFMETMAHGNDINAIRMAALDIARDLYGPNARLAIEDTGTIQKAVATHKGRFCAHVTVRCLDYPAEEL